MNIIRNLSIFISGAIVGTTCTYLYMKKYYSKAEYEELIPEETEEKPKEEKAEETKESSEDSNVYTSYVGYSSLNDDSMQDPEEREDEYEAYSEYSKMAEELTGEKADDDLAPYQITETEYLHGEPMYEKIPCVLYWGDQTLVQDVTDMDYDNDTVPDDTIMQIEDTIGTENYEIFRQNQDWEYMYIRNPKLGVDYEVYRSEESYKRLME